MSPSESAPRDDDGDGDIDEGDVERDVGVIVVVSGVGATHFNGVNIDARLRGGAVEDESPLSSVFPVMEWTDGTTP